MIAGALTLSFVAGTSQAAAAPRQRVSLNDGWQFSFGHDTIQEKVNLPHCWNEDAYARRDYRRGTGRYTRRLLIPRSDDPRSLYLCFDGAATRSEVMVDGHPAGSHIGGYSSHVVPLAKLAAPGDTVSLTVDVDNASADIPPFSADFTFMGGLYRDAWLLALDPVHLDIMSGPADGFKVTPGLCPDGNGTLTVCGAVVNDSPRKENVTVTVTLTSPDGAQVARRQQKIKVGPSGEVAPWSVDFGEIEAPQLWTPEQPRLYRVETAVSVGKKITDSADAPTAFRSFGFDDNGAFLLNGRPYKLRGMCRHQDQAPFGIALTDEMHRRDMRMMKDMGANFIRISHYPQDDAILEMCDRLGLIAWEEIPVIDYVPDNPAMADNAETMLREMIRSHYNHPSIAMWGYMNEILLRMPYNDQDATKARTRQLARRLERVLWEEDSSRMSTMAFHANDLYHGAGLGDITDVKGWNLYQGWYFAALEDFEGFLFRQHRDFPSDRLIVSEYGAGSDLRVHSFEPEPFDFSMEYQQKYLEHYLPVIEDSVFVAGGAHWNFIDFSSANRAESMPHINNKGLVTNSRRKKDVYHYYRAMWHDLAADTVAYLAVRDWPVRCDIASAEGTITHPVKVYTNLPQVALRVNGTQLPAADISNCNVIFPTTLRDGENLIELLLPDGQKVLDSYILQVSLIPQADGKIALRPGDEFAVNVGTSCFYRSDDSGLTWLPDREYRPGTLYGHSGGRRAVSQDEIELTRETPLMQRCITGLENYHVDLQPGRYEVELSFADLSAPSAHSAYMLGHKAGSGEDGLTVMDITINGNTVESDFAPARESGVKTAVTRRYQADVAADGCLDISFTPKGGTTSLTALKIRRL